MHRARGLDLFLSGSAESQLSFGVQREPCSKSGTTMTKGLFGRSICENVGRWWLAPPTASLQRTLRRAHAKHTETETHNIRAHTRTGARKTYTIFPAGSLPAPHLFSRHAARLTGTSVRMHECTHRTCAPVCSLVSRVFHARAVRASDTLRTSWPVALAEAHRRLKAAATVQVGGERKRLFLR